MSLPKIKSPVFEIEVPSQGKTYYFRPFLVKEEKILLMAGQSGQDKAIIQAIKQIINNCATEKININEWTMTDFEYVFLQLRAVSVNNVVDVTVTDKDDEQEYTFKVDLNDVKVVKDSEVSNKIEVNDEIIIMMKYPSADLIDKIGVYNDEMEILNFFVKNCIVEIYDNENVYPMQEQSEEDIQEFIDNLDVKTFDKIKDFLASSPKLNHTLTYTNSKGTEKKIVLDNIRDFFILG